MIVEADAAERVTLIDRLLVLRSPSVTCASPTDSADFRTLAGAVGDAFPRAPVGPYFGPWAATDARLFRRAGIPSYGFSPFPVVVFDTVQIARPNERMQLPAFRAGVRLYRETVRRLLSQRGPD